jgi:DNA-binding transcriptional ArsR family regulator
VDALEALADPTRRQIVELLAERERSAGEIASHFSVSRPAVSRHLRVLREHGLVRAREEAQRRLYSLDPAPLAELDAWLARYRAFWAERLDLLDLDLLDRGADLQADRLELVGELGHFLVAEVELERERLELSRLDVATLFCALQERASLDRVQDIMRLGCHLWRRILSRRADGVRPPNSTFSLYEEFPGSTSASAPP